MGLQQLRACAPQASAGRWGRTARGKDVSQRALRVASLQPHSFRPRGARLGLKARRLAGWRGGLSLGHRDLTARSSSNNNGGDSRDPDQLLDEFLTYFDTYMEKVFPQIQSKRDDMQSMRNVLELTQQMEKKLEVIQARRSEFGWLSRLMLTLISKCSETIKMMAEGQLDVLKEDMRSKDVNIVTADDRSYLEVKESEDAEASPSSSIRVNTIDSGTFDKQENPLYEKGNVIFSISCLLGAAVLSTSLAQTAGLDVESKLAMPDHPVLVAIQCLTWTAPAAVMSYTFWRWILETDTDASRVYRSEALANPEVLYLVPLHTAYGAPILTELSIVEVAIFSILLEVGGGLISRGCGLGISSLFFLGIPQLTETSPLFMDQPSAVLQPHFPEIWLWPIVALGCGTIEAVLYQYTKGGFREKSRDWLEDECIAALFSAVAVDELLKMDGGWMDLSTGGVNLPDELEDAIRPRDGTETPEQNERDAAYNFPLQDNGWANDLAVDLPAYMMMPSDDPALKQFVKTVPVSVIMDFTKQYSKNIKLNGPSMLYGPLQYLVKGTFLAAETIVTGSLWASIVTGSVMLIAEEMASRAYITAHPEVLDSK